MNDHAQRLADAAAPVGWFAWFLTHVANINAMLQTVLLAASIVATLAAAYYHIKKARGIKS